MLMKGRSYLTSFFSEFFFSREELSKLISALNEQKAKIKKTGVVVDGRKYNIKFTGTCNPLTLPGSGPEARTLEGTLKVPV